LKRALQITMLIVSVIPLALGIVNFYLGSGRIVPTEDVTPNLDSMWRFYSVWFTVVFFLTIWCVRNFDIAGPVMRIMFSVMAVGGLARIYSMTQVGMPDPPMLVATAVEVGVLAFIPWHAAVVGRQNALAT